MTKLTKRQNEILALIESHMAQTGSPPTRAEIAKTMGFRSPNAAEDHLRALARKGVIELVPGTSRGIRLTKNLGIPLIGRVSNKDSILHEDNIETFCRIDKNFFNPDIDYFIRIPNNDVKEFGILAGDIVAIHQTNKVQEGTLALLRTYPDIKIIRFSGDSLVQQSNVEGILVGIIRPLTPMSSYKE